MAAEKFVFANGPEKDPKPFVDKSDEGKRLRESQTTESSIVQYRTEGPSTNGSPAAVIAKDYSESDAEPQSDTDGEAAEPDTTPDTASDSDAAEGEEGKGS